MKRNINVSIVMATRNPNPIYFKECLDSIDAQTYQNFELIIIDDASDKIKIENMIEGYEFPVQIIKNQDQLGLAKSLNKGIKISRGKYVARIDDDDLMMPDRLEKEIKEAEKHRGFVHTRAKVIDENGKVLRESERIDNIKEKLKKSRNCLIHSSLLVEKSILDDLGGYDGNFVFAQDYALYMKAVDKYDFYLIDEPLVQYRVIKGRNSYEKKALSCTYSFVAAAEYFSEHRSLRNKLYFFRRTVIMLIKVYEYTFKDA